MTYQQLSEKAKVQKIGKVPVVVLPLAVWREVENRLEDSEMKNSGAFRKNIARARAQKKLYAPAEVKKMFRV